MKKMTIVFVCALATAVFCSSFVLAEEELSDEALIFMKVPVIVTAAKKEQPITESPATVYVITADDIKYSGLKRIPDILRYAPGVDVYEDQVYIRGFNKSRSNKVLLLLDGRSGCWNGYGIMMWELLPITTEDIERIEIIRSPGSSVYGANAYSGIINIITKRPEKAAGTKITLDTNTDRAYSGSVMHAGMFDKLKYKISGEYLSDKDILSNMGDLAYNIPNYWHAVKANALLEYELGETNTISLTGGRNHIINKMYYTSDKINGDFDFMQFEWDYTDIKFKTYWKNEEGFVGAQSFMTAIYDAELEHSFNLGEKNNILWSVDYKNTFVGPNTVIPAAHTLNQFSAFVEDEWKGLDKMIVSAACRYDINPMAGNFFSPRASIVYDIQPEHIIRVSISRAFRAPTFIESYRYSYFTMPDFGGGHLILMGNTNLKSEEVLSYEAGYQSVWNGVIKANANVFCNDYRNFITEVKMISGLDQIWLWENKGDAWGVGGEIDLNMFITDWLSGTANYSYELITDKQTNAVHEENPRNKVNCGVRMKFNNGIYINLLAGWIDETYTDGLKYPDNITLDPAVGYVFPDKRMEISIAGIYTFYLGPVPSIITQTQNMATIKAAYRF